MANRLWARRPQTVRNPIERDQRRPLARASHHIADQLDRAKLRIDDIHARRMAQEVEHRPIVDAPRQRLTDDTQKPFEPPTAGAEGADIADRAHGDFDQSRGVKERLGATLSLDNALHDLRRWLPPGRANGVIGVEAAD